MIGTAGGNSEIKELEKSLGIKIIENMKCEKCGGVLFSVPAPCFMKRKGWATAAKCIRGCSFMAGHQKRRRR